MKIINREEIKEDLYREILDVETHHEHPIIEDEQGTLRWKKNEYVREIIDEKISLNDLLPMLCFMGYDKNSEVYRKLYRDMGYSLYGYWEVFYWVMNNEKASDYIPNTK